jgi:hypothetical protein
MTTAIEIFLGLAAIGIGLAAIVLLVGLAAWAVARVWIRGFTGTLKHTDELFSERNINELASKRMVGGTGPAANFPERRRP